MRLLAHAQFESGSSHVSIHMLLQAEARQQKHNQSAVGKAQRKIDADIKRERQSAPDRRPDTAQDWLS